MKKNSTKILTLALFATFGVVSAGPFTEFDQIALNKWDGEVDGKQVTVTYQILESHDAMVEEVFIGQQLDSVTVYYYDHERRKIMLSNFQGSKRSILELEADGYDSPLPYKFAQFEASQINKYLKSLLLSFNDNVLTREAIWIENGKENKKVYNLRKKIGK